MSADELVYLLATARHQTDAMDKSSCGRSQAWDPIEWNMHQLKGSSQKVLANLAAKHVKPSL